MTSAARPRRALSPQQQAIERRMTPFSVLTSPTSSLPLPAEMLVPLARRPAGRTAGRWARPWSAR